MVLITLGRQKLKISLLKSHLLLLNDTAFGFRERLRNRVVIIIGDASFYHHHLGNYFPSALLMSGKFLPMLIYDSYTYQTRCTQFTNQPIE